MEEKYITKEEIIKLDKELKMVPLTVDLMFKSVFTYDLDILKEFVILETGLSLDPKETEITLLNNELPKSKVKEYKKTIDIYVKLNNRININVELNNSSFNEYLTVRNELYTSKLFSLMFESGDKSIDFLEKKLIQLNLNTEDISLNYGDDIIIPYGIKTGKIYPQNRETILKYLAYYRKMYYTFNVNLTKAELWLVVILSKNFEELYDLLDKLLTKEKKEKFLRKVIEMSKDTFILSEWEKEKMDELKELARLKDAEDKGIKQGIEKGIEKNKLDIAKNMLESNMSIDMISKFTGLSTEEIENLRN